MTNENRNDIFLNIADSCYHGQWTYAAEQCVKHNFFAKDLVEVFEETEAEQTMISATDLVFLIEQATQIRLKRN